MTSTTEQSKLTASILPTLFTLKWTNTTRPNGSPFNFVDVVDLDGNGTPEIIAGNTVAHTGSEGVYVYIYDYPSGANPWRSVVLLQQLHGRSLDWSWMISVETAARKSPRSFPTGIFSRLMVLPASWRAWCSRVVAPYLSRRIPSGLIKGG